MMIPNGNGAAVNGAMPTPTVIPSKFDTTAMTTFWMSGSARLMRSSEVFMRGMTAVAKLEAELGQQYMQRAMAALQTFGLGAMPDQRARAQIDQTMLGLNSLITTMLKIADEFRQTVNESTQALFDVSSPGPQQSLAASIHIDDPAAKGKQAQSAAGLPFTG
jgi:hypothetical protein